MDWYRKWLVDLNAGKHKWFCLTSLITLVLLTWKGISLFLKKNYLLRCFWGWLSWYYIIFFLFYSQKPYKTLYIYIYIYIYIYLYILSNTNTHMHAYAYICLYTVYAYVHVDIYIIIYISTAMLRENRTCRRVRVISSNHGNILK